MRFNDTVRRLAAGMQARTTAQLASTSEAISQEGGRVAESAASSALANHEAALDPHPQYLTAAEALTDPTTTEGDLIYRGAVALTRLGIGGAGTFLRSVGGVPAWVALTWAMIGSTPTTLAGYGITDAVSSTATQTANTVLAGPTTGSPAAPTFRALVSGDLPSHNHTVGQITPVTTARLIGRTTTGSGAAEEISVSASMSLSAGVLSTAAGTAFPGSPASGDRFFRTDLGWQCYYDGTRWLTAHEYQVSLGIFGGSPPYTSAPQNPLAAPNRSDRSYYITRCAVIATVTTTNNGTNYWTFSMRDSAGTILGPSSAASWSTAADAADVALLKEATINAVASTVQIRLRIDTRVGTPGNLFLSASYWYRLIVT